ncbi:histidine phosphatase family protein [Actinoplanes sp. NBRC 101535]|uniref:histidine phosphatase family protein n=1 Tax=Actinoplanes sp. NBRC 101535 TaxID=3032196 RepID=UPI00249F9808|nr:histidine phosphatase family protein [Actinoplanes sp. NBRC 101535]GLY02951.1 phosphoglycerate mutase [Actinoplanes sp. NBRC 101535]
MSGLRLIAAAPTPGLRRARFGGDEDLDEGGLRASLALSSLVRSAKSWTTSPSRASRQTTRALGGDTAITSAHVETALADPVFGTWTGRTLDQIDPAVLRTWLSDPDFRDHGGESLAQAGARAATWLSTMTEAPPTTTAPAGATRTGGDGIVVAHPLIIRALLTAALGLPPAGYQILDVAPLSITRLTHRSGRWRLHFPTPVPSPW